MKFKITSVSKEKETVVHYYDNMTQEITTEKGIPVCLEKDPRLQDFVEHKRHRNNEQLKPASNEIYNLRIQLGLNCNFSCKYCNQSAGNETDKQSHRMTLPNETRVKYLIGKLKQYDIKPKQVVLWGGEPFVYWKLLKVLVPELRKMYPIETTSLSLITNGSLLNDEIADFCIEHSISVTISHDGPSFEKYRNDKNPLDNPVVVKAFNRIIDHANVTPNMWTGINCVVVPENCDLTKLDEYFTSKVGREDIHWHFESIAKVDRWGKDKVTPFDAESTKTLLNSMLIEGTKEQQKIRTDLRQRVSKCILDLVKHRDPLKHKIPCDVASSDVLTTTLEGELLACHGASRETHCIGHIDNFREVINNKVFGWDERPKCKECPFLIFCGGGCAVAQNEDVEIMCDNLKLWHGGIFACAWYLLFDSVIQKIEPVYE